VRWRPPLLLPPPQPLQLHQLRLPEGAAQREHPT